MKHPLSTSLLITAIFAVALIGMSVAADDGTPARESQRPTIHGLVAAAPAPHLSDALQLFGQFVGDWEIDGRWFQESGQEVTATGEVHFGWILEGTAIQDVWSFHIKNPPPGYPSDTSGTTVRVYDPGVRSWRCVWISPRKPTLQLFTARAVGSEIVLEGRTPEGYPERWIYSDVTPGSFRWHSEESHDDGRTWKTTEVILGRRVGVR
jgi:hypothetical protein